MRVCKYLHRKWNRRSIRQRDEKCTKNSTKYAWEKCCEKCYERENAGLCQRGPTNLYFNETIWGEKENIGSKRKRRGEKTRVQKVSGCALCEKKESSHWYKNTDTGERDICNTCY